MNMVRTKSLFTHLRGVVDASNHPWKTKAQKYIDTIATSDIAHSVIGGLLRYSGGLGGESVG